MFILNPRSWGLDYDYMRPDDFNPKMHHLIIRLLMFRIEFIIDDGSCKKGNIKWKFKLK